MAGSGAITTDDFVKKFFPSIVYVKMKYEMRYEDGYCQFDSQMLTFFSSSHYLVALVASFFASYVTRALGRKISMFLGGLFFLLGSVINSVAANIEMLVIGRLLLGVGVGFGNQSVPIYLSEMAPTKIRGALSICFQMAITIGILIAFLVHYSTYKIEGEWGWRASLAFAAVPGLIMALGSLFLPDTPNSILVRGHNKKAKKLLQKIRGTEQVDEEFQDLIDASEAAKKVQNPWKTITQPRYRPQLVLCILIPFFQQLTGINIVMFFAPFLLKSLGLGEDVALLLTIIAGIVNVLATFAAIFLVDKLGRRILFLEGGIQMTICQVIKPINIYVLRKSFNT